MKIERYDDDFAIVRGLLDADEQATILAALKAGMNGARFSRPLIGRGKHPMSLEMMCFGAFEWQTQPRYHYAPLSGRPIPPVLLAANDRLCDVVEIPRIHQQTALFNLYKRFKTAAGDERESKLSLHVDEDEKTGHLGVHEPAVLSLSFGPAEADMLVELSTGTIRVSLAGGDGCVLAGRSRRARHGIPIVRGAWRGNTTTRQVVP